MKDLKTFASAHPGFSDPAQVRVPGQGAVPPIEGARPLELAADHDPAAAKVRVQEVLSQAPSALRDAVQGVETTDEHVAVRFRAAADLAPTAIDARTVECLLYGQQD